MKNTFVFLAGISVMFLTLIVPATLVRAQDNSSGSTDNGNSSPDSGSSTGSPDNSGGSSTGSSDNSGGSTNNNNGGGTDQQSGYSLTVNVNGHGFGKDRVNIRVTTENGFSDSKEVATAGGASWTFNIPANQGNGVEVCVGQGLIGANCKKFTASGSDFAVSMGAAGLG